MIDAFQGDAGDEHLSHAANILGAGCSFETFQVVHVCIFGPVDGCQASDLFLRGFGPHVISAPANRD